jgi:uncharacterized membrane protein
VAPHLRFGTGAGSYDVSREAFCAPIAPGAAFLYTGDDPGSYTGEEADDVASLLDAARERCGCCVASEYTLTKIGGVDAVAVAINDGGAVIGGGTDPAGFVWTPLPGDRTQGVLHPLPPLPGYTGMELHGINADGDVVGASNQFLPPNSVALAATLWEDLVPRPIGPGGQSVGLTINDAGVIGGRQLGAGILGGGWVLAPPVPPQTEASLTTLPGSGAPQAMNAHAAFAGIALSGVGLAFQPAYWPNAATLPTLLDTPGGNGHANDITDAGWMVGDYGNGRPFLWQGADLMRLPTPALPDAFWNGLGTARAINERGEIVGELFVRIEVEDYLGKRAVLWKDGVATDLNALLSPADRASFVLETARDVNERGQIVGWGVDFPFQPSYDSRAVLLTPKCGE